MSGCNTPHPFACRRTSTLSLRSRHSIDRFWKGSSVKGYFLAGSRCNQLTTKMMMTMAKGQGRQREETVGKREMAGDDAVTRSDTSATKQWLSRHCHPPRGLRSTHQCSRGICLRLRWCRRLALINLATHQAAAGSSSRACSVACTAAACRCAARSRRRRRRRSNATGVVMVVVLQCVTDASSCRIQVVASGCSSHRTAGGTAATAAAGRRTTGCLVLRRLRSARSRATPRATAGRARIAIIIVVAV